MLAHLADVSVRALALAAIAAAVPGRKRSAAMQHAVWTVVVLGMLGLLVFGPALPRLPVVVPTRATVPERLPAPPAQWAAYDVNGIPFVRVTSAAVLTPAPKRRIDWGEVAVNLYASVAGVLLLRFAIGLLLAWRLVRSSTRVGGFFESALINVPLTVGCLRPRILLPMDWREWDRAKLEAVLAHESAHVRRWDGSIAMLAGINRCVFWLHPLAWWIERRLGLLAELACDEACVAELGDGCRYASLLLEMAQTVDGSRGRLRGPLFSMAASSHLRRRIELILEKGRTFHKGLSRTALAAITLCGIPVVLGAGTLVLDGPTPLPPLLMFQRPPYVPSGAPPPPPPPRPAPRQSALLKFEVASIRLAAPSGPPLPAGPATPGALPPTPPPPGGPACFPRSATDGGRVDRICASVKELLADAFGVPPSLLTAPDWTEVERFDISAKLPAGATPEDIPAMLQSLLDDRFGMRSHREFRDGTVHNLIVAKGGPKPKQAAPEPVEAEWMRAAKAAMGPFGNGRIGGVRFRSIPVPGPDASFTTVWETPGMGFVRRSDTGGLSGTIHYEAPNISAEGLAELATLAGNGLDTPVVDRTGLAGRYQVNLDISMADLIAEVRANRGDVAAAHRAELDVLQSGLKKLGLEIESRKMPVEMIVIDHVEKTPTAN